MKIQSLKSILIVVFFILLFFMAGCERDEKQPETDPSLKSSEAIMSDMLAEKVPPVVQELSDSVSNDPQIKAIHAAHEALVKKYNIEVSNQEIHDFAEKYYGPLISESDFQEIKEKMESHLNKAEFLLSKGQSIANDVNDILGVLGVEERPIPEFSEKTTAQLEALRRLIPASREEMFQKSIPINRDLVEMVKVARIILPEIQRQGDLWNWDENYKKALLDYAKKNHLDKDPALDGVAPENLDTYHYHPSSDSGSFDTVPNDPVVPREDLRQRGMRKNALRSE